MDFLWCFVLMHGFGFLPCAGLVELPIRRNEGKIIAYEILTS